MNKFLKDMEKYKYTAADLVLLVHIRSGSALKTINQPL